MMRLLNPNDLCDSIWISGSGVHAARMATKMISVDLDAYRYAEENADAGALATDTPLVSRNAREFAGGPNLRAVGY